MAGQWAGEWKACVIGARALRIALAAILLIGVSVAPRAGTLLF